LVEGGAWMSFQDELSERRVREVILECNENVREMLARVTNEAKSASFFVQKSLYGPLLFGSDCYCARDVWSRECSLQGGCTPCSGSKWASTG